MGKIIQSQYVDLDNVTSNLRSFYVKAYTGISPKKAPNYWLFFQASVPPLGWNTFFISKTSQKGNGRTMYVSTMESPKEETIEIGPGNFKLSFSTASGQLKRMFNSKSRIDIPVQQSYLWYASSPGDADPQSSGAYIFRPNGSPPQVVSRSVSDLFSS
ncbi:probable alpha-mannosidase At5g66150 [Olea europaea var. sylvestris]|uniref:probable alpha-mannosidase At5g66150 n=1 Tax=Olea europaea var. sylvestris TaxID=158386 RepID=UPI000C1D1B89|nr:probable alpha-mannosidase At5g66150 [Olea europaea var. sylvestris]